MLPTCDQIQRAAYERWRRRGWIHGCDREDWYAAERELMFLLNYRTIVEYPIDGAASLVLGDTSIRCCRFCERTSGQASFAARHPAVPGPLGNGSLLTSEICDDCQADCRDPLDDDFRRLWSALRAHGTGREGANDSRIRNLYSVAAFKSLVASALLIMPRPELRYFPDTLEWVSNPDHEADIRLFAGSVCRVYSPAFLGGRAWTSLAKRIDDEAPTPYLLYFLGCDGIILQVHLPLCLRDEDLDGRGMSMPERSMAAGDGSDFRETPCRVLPLALARRRASTLSSLDPFR